MFVSLLLRLGALKKPNRYSPERLSSCSWMQFCCLCAPHLLRSLCFSDPWWKSCCFKAFCNIWNCCYGVGSHKPQLLLFWVGFVAVVGCWTVDTLNNPGKTQCFSGFKSVFSNAQVCVWISGQREDTFVNRLSNSGLPNLLEITCCQVVCGCL